VDECKPLGPTAISHSTMAKEYTSEASDRCLCFSSSGDCAYGRYFEIKAKCKSSSSYSGA